MCFFNASTRLQRIDRKLQTLWMNFSTVVGGSQQLPCMYNVLQAANERPEPFPSEEVEANSPG